MEEMHKTQTTVEEYFNGLSSDELMNFHNEYCDAHDYSDDRIYTNDEDFLNENFSDVMSAVRAVCYGEYTFTDKYVRFDGLANLESFDHVEHYIEIDDLVSDAMEYPERYDIEFIDPNDLDDRELFDYLYENDAFEGQDNADSYNETWTRERLEMLGGELDLI